MRIATIAAVAGSLLLPAAAHAAPSVYGSLNVGGASTDDLSTVIYAPEGSIFPAVSEADALVIEGGVAAPNGITVGAGVDTISGAYDIKPAVAISGSIGLDWGLIRTDVEVAYSRATVRAFNVRQISSGTSVSTDFQDAAGDACSYIEVTPCPISGNSIALDGVKLRQLSGMANVWIDIPTDTKLEPYLGGGLGVTGLEVDGETKARFSWQVGAGIAYRIMPKLALSADVRYRETDPVNIDFGGNSGVEFGRVKTISYGLGLRYTF